MPKSKHKKMVRNIPKANPQKPAVVEGTQAPIGTTVTASTKPAVSAPKPVTSSYTRPSFGKTVTLPTINYIGKELRTIGILSVIIIVAIIVLSFVLR